MSGWNINPPRTGAGGACRKHGVYAGNGCPKCAESRSIAPFLSSVQRHRQPPPERQGWTCPVCRRGVAWWMPYCDHGEKQSDTPGRGTCPPDSVSDVRRGSDTETGQEAGT